MVVKSSVFRIAFVSVKTFAAVKNRQYVGFGLNKIERRSSSLFARFFRALFFNLYSVIEVLMYFQGSATVRAEKSVHT